jgi:hypothetical protein
MQTYLQLHTRWDDQSGTKFFFLLYRPSCFFEAYFRPDMDWFGVCWAVG